ncbi:MAG: flagellar basal body protein, partial [Immundisolibacteraceae bacterium]|nr:flagellar basal body protein [Immundisolibacteraceae bacterium]
MSFKVALSGINSASADLDVISNNLANLSTTGY